MTLHVLIVDDEPLGRQRLRTLLASEPDIASIDECGDGASAVTAVLRRRPDVLFLDIEMPGMNGFDVVDALGVEKMPPVVFVTAYDEHAVRAFESCALDYLLKPSSRARVRRSLERVRTQLALASSQHEAALLELMASRPRRIAVRVGERSIYVPVDEIDWVEAAGNYIVLHAGCENHIIRETLASLETRLDPGVFQRFSRSTIVNLRRVRELLSVFPGEHVAVLRDGQRIPITRDFRKIQERLKFS